MSDVPSNLIPTRITGLPEYLGTSTLGYLPYVIEGNTYKVQFANIAAVGAVPSTREINTGSGLGGGGDLSANRTLYILPGGVDDSRLTTTGVTAGTYGAADSIPVLTVNAQGRVTGVTNTPIVLSGYVPTSRTITAGAGLTGGGDLSANRSFAVNFSSTTPEPLGPGSPGVSTVAARGDHVHPAVDLSDTTETQGVLPLSRGGTGNSLSPVVGAIAYSSNDRLNLTPTSGNAGDVLVSAGGLAPPFWQAPIGGGTVTSINASGGTTGMSFTGGPVTTIGTLTLGGTLGVANGGTGATDAATALTNLGAYPASNPAGYTSNVGTVTSVSGTGTVSGLSLSGTVTSAGSLTLGGTLVVTPSDFASQSANTVLAAPNGSAGVPTFRAIVAADIPTLNQNTTGTASNVTGIVAVANGGTGASVAGTARTNLSAAASGANTDITSIALTTGTISTSPTSGTDIVNKTYADSIASGINFHQSVRLATAAALPANTYNNGTSGVGATLTANANAALSVDGVAVVVGNRILVKNEVAQANNGVYTVTQVGDGSTPYILTRATDFDSAGTGVDQIDAGDFFLVTAGSTQSNTSWVQQTPLPITVGTTAIVFTQFAAPVLYSAGTGLTLAGTVFSITNTGVSASTYGSASSVPVLAINAQGQVTSASSSSIAIAASQITSGTVSVAQGGTGATTLTANGVLLGNGTSAISATAVGSTGQVLVGNTGGAPSWATLSGIGVTSFSAGTTGLTPSSGTTGAITLAGTLNVANGGTGATSLTSGYLVKGNGTSAASASVVYDDGTNVGIGNASIPYVTSGRTVFNVNGTSSAIISLQTSGSNRGYFYGDGSTIAIEAESGCVLKLNTISAQPMTFFTSNTERMRITSTGDVGIGTSAPGGKLHVVTGTNDSLLLRGPISLGTGGSIYAVNAANTAIAPFEFGASVYSFAGGNVGIGTSAPSQKLHVVGAQLTVPAAGWSAGQIAYNYLGDTNNGVKSTNGGNVNVFSYNGFDVTVNGPSPVTVMTITAGTNVGIGTASPAQKLDVVGIVLAREDTAAGATPVLLRNSNTGNNTTKSSSALFQGTDTVGTVKNIGSIGFFPDDANYIGANLRFLVRSGDAAPTERVRVTSAGFVGIGTSAPQVGVHVSFADQSTNRIRLQNTGSGGGNFDIIGGLAGASNAGLSFFDVTNSATRMVIDSSGNVGIGTSSPSSKLDVVAQDAIRATGFQPFLTLRDSSDSNKGSRIQTASAITIFYNDTTGGGTYTERMRIDSSGNVGIGTSSPAVKLDVNGSVNFGQTLISGGGVSTGDCAFELGGNRSGSGNSYIDFHSTSGTDFESRIIRYGGTNGGMDIINSGTGGMVLSVSGAAPMAFQTSGTERARITSAGYFLVGTTAPLGANTSNEFKTTTAGSWPLTINSNDRGILHRQSSATTGFYEYFEYNGGTNNGSISYSGGTTAYNTTSDARIKKNIVDAPDAGSLIDAIKVRSWDFKADDVHWRYGMVAQELLPVAPEAVTVPEDEEMMMGVDYAKLVPMLIKEVQSLRARVAQLEGN